MATIEGLASSGCLEERIAVRMQPKCLAYTNKKATTRTLLIGMTKKNCVRM